MPGQDNPFNQPLATPVNPVPTSPPIEEVTVPFGTTTAPPTQTTQTVSTPPNFPPIISTPKRKKFGGKRIIATILGILVLVGGLAAGTILVRQRQEIREKAEGPNPISVACTDGNPPRGLLVVHQFDSKEACEACENDSDCRQRLVAQPSDPNVCPAGNNYIGTTTNPYDGRPTVCTDLGDCSGNVCSSTYPNCAAVQIDCLNNLGGGINAGNLTINCGSCAPPQTNPPATGQCLNIKAYNTSWVEITNLSSLKSGDRVRFTVAGSAASGSFDRARFTINGTLRSEVTAKKPDSEEFFDEYTIPAGITNFSVKGELHHTTLGWF